MKRILIAPAHYLLSDKYGSEPLWAYEIVAHLAKNVEEVDVICGVLDLQTALPKNVNVFPIYVNRSGNVYWEFLKRVLFYPFVFWTFIKLNFKHHYTVVHHLFPLSIATLNPIIFFGKLFGVKKIVLGPLQLPQTTFSKQDLKLVLVGNSKSDWSGYLIVPIYVVMLFFIKPLSRLMFRMADQVICNSKSSKKYYQEVDHLKNVLVIPTGITMRAVKKKKIDKISILCIGQLNKRKGQTLLMEAFYRLTESYGKDRLQLNLVGDGELREDLMQFISEHKLNEIVKIHKVVPHDRIWSFYDDNLVYCLPSISDPSPTVLLEAMMSNLAVVATDVGAVSEMVGDGGIIVESNNVDALMKGLEKLIADAVLIATLSKNGRKRIEDIYDWNQIVKKYIDLYEKKG